MKKALLIASVLFVAVVSTACINNIAVQELNNKAAEFMQKGDYDSAMNRLQASLDLDNSVYETYYNLGIASINAKKYEKAIEAFKKGIELKPDYANFYYSLAVAQATFADEILESNDEVENITFTDEQKIEQKKELSQTDLDKIKELKTEAYENLQKFVELVPTNDNQSDIKSLINDLESYLKINESRTKE